MMSNIIDSSKHKWKLSDILPPLYKKEDKFISKDLILFFDDGFISRGCYILDEGWYGYDTNMKLEHYITNPKYYLTI